MVLSKTVLTFIRGHLRRSLLFTTVILSQFGPLALAATDNTTAPLFAQHCAQCHGTDRLGGTGPALLPENLERLKPAGAVKTISAGRAATQMPAFAGKLSRQEIQALTDFIYTPPAQEPRWGLAEINASRVIRFKPGALGDKPVYTADPLNLFLVVEQGDHHATVLDGDKLEPIARFATRYALHGGPKYSPDGRYVYLCSRDGWVSKFDMYNLKTVAEIRAGINTRNLAVSGDGKVLMAGNYLPHTLVALSADDLSVLKIIPVQDDKGTSSRVSAVYAAPPRHSFIAALKDIPEVWEIPYDAHHEPIYPGLVHDYRMGEAMALQEPLPVRRIHLDAYLDDFFFDQDYKNLIGASRDGGKGQVVSLIVGRKIADIDLPGMPHLGSGITFAYHGHRVLATPNLKEAVVSVIDMTNWKTIKRIDTLGPGFFIRSNEQTPYAWVDGMLGKRSDTMQLIDKNTLAIVKELTPAPGKAAAHVEFDRHGRYALLSIMEMAPAGALVVYDAKTLKEVKRIPMNKPIGKYNVYNKIHYEEGTSH